MFADRMHRLIGRALIDRRFREVLLQRPGEAIRDLPFTGLERSVVSSLRASSLEEFSRELDEKLEIATQGGSPEARPVHPAPSEPSQGQPERVPRRESL